MPVWKGIMQQMENLVFSLNATVPVFLIPLPVLVFSDLATVDFEEVWNMKFVLFCFGATVISIAISTAVSFLWKDKSIQGEFIQSSYRSSAALLGIAFIQNIYGTAGMACLLYTSPSPRDKRQSRMPSSA